MSWFLSYSFAVGGLLRFPPNPHDFADSGSVLGAPVSHFSRPGHSISSVSVLCCLPALLTHEGAVVHWRKMEFPSFPPYELPLQKPRGAGSGPAEEESGNLTPLRVWQREQPGPPKRESLESGSPREEEILFPDCQLSSQSHNCSHNKHI